MESTEKEQENLAHLLETLEKANISSRTFPNVFSLISARIWWFEKFVFFWIFAILVFNIVLMVYLVIARIHDPSDVAVNLWFYYFCFCGLASLGVLAIQRTRVRRYYYSVFWPELKISIKEPTIGDIEYARFTDELAKIDNLPALDTLGRLNQFLSIYPNKTESEVSRVMSSALSLFGSSLILTFFSKLFGDTIATTIIIAMTVYLVAILAGVLADYRRKTENKYSVLSRKLGLFLTGICI